MLFEQVRASLVYVGHGVVASVRQLSLGRDVLLKREDLQPVFSFKIRGAYNCIARLSPAARAAGVICASAGNHAQGVALSAQRLGIAATIVMPVTTPLIKIDAVRYLGGKVVLHGDTFEEAHERARKDLEKVYASGATSENWCFVVLDDGKTVAYVSWNGRMWEGDPRRWTDKTREIV